MEIYYVNVVGGYEIVIEIELKIKVPESFN